MRHYCKSLSKTMVRLLLKYLTAAGMKERRKRSVRHCGMVNLPCRKMWRSISVSWRGCPVLASLLPTRISIWSRLCPTTELAFLINLFSLPVSRAEALPPEHTSPLWYAPVTTVPPHGGIPGLVTPSLR